MTEVSPNNGHRKMRQIAGMDREVLTSKRLLVANRETHRLDHITSCSGKANIPISVDNVDAADT